MSCLAGDDGRVPELPVCREARLWVRGVHGAHLVLERAEGGGEGEDGSLGLHVAEDAGIDGMRLRGVEELLEHGRNVDHLGVSGVAVRDQCSQSMSRASHQPGPPENRP